MRAPIAIAGAALLLAVTSSACGSSKAAAPTTAPTTADPAALAGEPRYAEPGPYGVGVTTLHLPSGRAVEVYYPADKADTAGKPLDRYDEAEPVPAAIRAQYTLPAGTDLHQEIPAVRDVAVSGAARFPLVIFSHGSGGWRDVYGTPLSGVASWGFVIASTDYDEYGLIASFSGALDDGESHATQVVATADATIDLLVAEDGRAGGPFASRIDTAHIAAAGHSAGGATMFRLLDEKRVGTIIGWAAVGPSAGVTSTTPTLLIAGDADAAVTPQRATAAYEALKAPKRIVSIARMGHNAFSDTCLAISKGTDLIGLAKAMKVPIPDSLLELGRDGCRAENLPTATGWKVIQHLTVAQLRAAFALDPTPVGLGDAIATAFPGVTMTIRHEG
jgi:predicted dienelactone hydrolase